MSLNSQWRLDVDRLLCARSLDRQMFQNQRCSNLDLLFFVTIGARTHISDLSENGSVQTVIFPFEQTAVRTWIL